MTGAPQKTLCKANFAKYIFQSFNAAQSNYSEVLRIRDHVDGGISATHICRCIEIMQRNPPQYPHILGSITGEDMNGTRVIAG